MSEKFYGNSIFDPETEEIFFEKPNISVINKDAVVDQLIKINDNLGNLLTTINPEDQTVWKE